MTEISVSMWINPNALVEDQEQALLAANGTWDAGTVYIYIFENEISGLVIEDAEAETSIVSGPAEKIKSLVFDLEVVKNVREVRLFIA